MKSPKEKKYYKFQKFEYYNKGVSQTEEQQLENTEVNNYSINYTKSILFARANYVIH